MMPIALKIIHRQTRCIKTLKKKILARAIIHNTRFILLKYFYKWRYHEENWVVINVKL